MDSKNLGHSIAALFAPGSQFGMGDENSLSFCEFEDDVCRPILTMLSRRFKIRKTCILLVDSFRGWLYDRLGFQGHNRSSLFAHTLNNAAPRVVTISDLSMDFRFHSDSLSQNAGFRSYTGISLVVEGVKIGVLALFDCATLADSNAITKSQELLLTEFADTVAGILSDRWIDQTEAAVSSVRIHQGVLGVLQEPLHKMGSVLSGVSCHVYSPQTVDLVAFSEELNVLSSWNQYIQRIIELALQLIAVEQMHTPHSCPRARGPASLRSMPSDMWTAPTPFKFNLQRWVWNLHRVLTESGLIRSPNSILFAFDVSEDLLAAQDFYWLDSHPNLLILSVVSLLGQVSLTSPSSEMIEVRNATSPRIKLCFNADMNETLRLRLDISFRHPTQQKSKLSGAFCHSVDSLLEFLHGTLAASSPVIQGTSDSWELSVPVYKHLPLSRNSFKAFAGTLSSARALSLENQFQAHGSNMPRNLVNHLSPTDTLFRSPSARGSTSVIPRQYSPLPSSYGANITSPSMPSNSSSMSSSSTSSLRKIFHSISRAISSTISMSWVRKTPINSLNHHSHQKHHEQRRQSRLHAVHPALSTKKSQNAANSGTSTRQASYSAKRAKSFFQKLLLSSDANSNRMPSLRSRRLSVTRRLNQVAPNDDSGDGISLHGHRSDVAGSGAGKDHVNGFNSLFSRPPALIVPSSTTDAADTTPATATSSTCCVSACSVASAAACTAKRSSLRKGSGLSVPSTCSTATSTPTSIATQVDNFTQQ